MNLVSFLFSLFEIIIRFVFFFPLFHFLSGQGFYNLSEKLYIWLKTNSRKSERGTHSNVCHSCVCVCEKYSLTSLNLYFILPAICLCMASPILVGVDSNSFLTFVVKWKIARRYQTERGCDRLIPLLYFLFFPRE